MKNHFLISFLFIIIYLGLNYSLFSQEYIKVNIDEVNIRFSSNNSSAFVAKGMKGDIFKLEETKGEWYAFYICSGEYRYIHKSSVQLINSIPLLTSSVETRKKLFKELFRVEGKAIEEADLKYSNDLDKLIDYQRILEDRYKLIVFRNFSIPTPYYNKIITEGATNKW